ncbi:hypothetical protein H0H93_000639 [Arthromyces matolae]|nr:hypothetical protein H0H93_000639 [Arthromyces matolae]
MLFEFSYLNFAIHQFITVPPNSSIDGEAAELTAKETINVPKNFIPTGPNLKLSIPEDSDGLESVINIVGLMRTAVQKSSAKQFSNWVARLRFLKVWKRKHIPAGKSDNTIPLLKPAKLAERKELIKKVVEKHNKGIWFKPDEELEEEIEKGLDRSRTVVRKKPPLVAGTLEDEKKETVPVPNDFIPEETSLRLWIPEDRDGLNSVIYIIGLMRTAIEGISSSRQLTNWTSRLKNREFWKGKKISIPGGKRDSTSMKTLKGDKLKERKELIKQVVEDHNEGKWFKPDRELKKEIEGGLQDPGELTEGHGASYATTSPTQWPGNGQEIGGHETGAGGIDNAPPMISASPNLYSTIPHTFPYRGLASESHPYNRFEANLSYHSSFGQPVLDHAGPSSGIPTGGLPVYDNHRHLPVIQGTHNGVPALPLNVHNPISPIPPHQALASESYTNPHTEVDLANHMGIFHPLLDHQLLPMVHGTDMSLFYSHHEHGQNGAVQIYDANDHPVHMDQGTAMHFDHTLMTMEGQQNHTGGGLLGAFSGHNMSWNMEFGHTMDHSHAGQHGNGYDIGVLMGERPPHNTYDHNQLSSEEEHTPYFQ